MSATIPQQGISERLDAEIAAHGRPPVSDKQIAATLASIGAALRDVPAASSVCEVQGCGAGAECELHDGTWLCERHFGRVVGDVAALAAPVIPKTDAIQEARGHIRAALRSAHDAERELHACECANPELPNAGTAITRELTLALDALKDAVTG